MKKIFFLSLCLSLSILLSSALKAQEFKAGAIIGMTPSQVDGDRIGGFYKVGFTGGLFVYRDVSKVSRWQGELLFTMKGSKTHWKSLDYTIQQVSTSNVDLNLLYIFKYNSWLHFRLGLTPSVLISSSEENISGLAPAEAPAFRRFGLGFTTGVTYNFSDKLGISWNYNYSLISIRSGEFDYYNLNVYQKNGQFHNYMSFTLNYRF